MARVSYRAARVGVGLCLVLRAGGAAALVAASTLGVVVNVRDPGSVAIGEYYRDRRGVPPENVVRLEFAPDRTELDPVRFGLLKARLDAALPPRVQVLALAWTTPYRVGCMSVTSAFALGYDPAFCNRPGACDRTRLAPTYDARGSRPFADFGVRPAMLLAGRDVASVRTLIDRGIAADATFPAGTGYLLSTHDVARNVRAMFYPHALAAARPGFRLRMLASDVLRGRDDVLFYFTGLPRVPALVTNRFLPGAVADHLTSTGGMLTDSTQMSALAWLEAGATASYGAVAEPCNFTGKFPNPAIVIKRYTGGETLISAYWKSVAHPGQGVFIGEPLARPFARLTGE